MRDVKISSIGKAFVLLVGVSYIYLTGIYRQLEPRGVILQSLIAADRTPIQKEKTLVVYVYKEQDIVHAENFEFFLLAGIFKNPNPLVDYLLIINGDNKKLDLSGLPPNVRVVSRGSTCFTGGAIGDVLGRHPEYFTPYDYYVFLDSSVRGPFLPVYFPTELSWTHAFTSRLNKRRVKLVGTAISCQTKVHVQSSVLATDREGLNIMNKAGALRCAHTMNEAIDKYQLGSSSAILSSGYNIDSLMTRYRGVDWRSRRDVKCNGGIDPSMELAYDGMNMDPFEVMFVKARFGDGATRTHNVRRYSDYYLGVDKMEENEYLLPKIQGSIAQAKADLMALASRCAASFDGDYYRSQNADLATYPDPFGHFVDHGFREKRPYRFMMDEEKWETDPRLEDECSPLLYGVTKPLCA